MGAPRRWCVLETARSNACRRVPRGRAEQGEHGLRAELRAGRRADSVTRRWWAPWTGPSNARGRVPRRVPRIDCAELRRRGVAGQREVLRKATACRRAELRRTSVLLSLYRGDGRWCLGSGHGVVHVKCRARLVDNRTRAEGGARHYTTILRLNGIADGRKSARAARGHG